MRTETISIYQYNELTGAAKERAKQWLIDAETSDAAFMYEINDTIKVIEDTFNIVIRSDGYGNYWYKDKHYSRDAKTMEFKRAIAYINNEFDFKCKPYHIEQTQRNAAERKPENKYKYPIYYRKYFALAKARYEDNLPTDVCYDYIIHDVYKKFIENERKHAGETLDIFFKGLAREIGRTIENEYEYIQTDEYIDDIMSANEYEFTSDGKRYVK